jgi:putative ABC transport system permease protein
MSALASFTHALNIFREIDPFLERNAGPMDEAILQGLISDPSVESFSPVIDRRLRVADGSQIRISESILFSIRQFGLSWPDFFFRRSEKGLRRKLSFVLEEKAV